MENFIDYSNYVLAAYFLTESALVILFSITLIKYFSIKNKKKSVIKN
jgi:hypothetical protein